MKIMVSSKIKKVVAGLSILGFATLSGVAFAADLKSAADSVGTGITAVGPVMAGIGFLIGLVFLLFGITQFKKHKDNPQQTALSIPIVLVAVGAALVFLPTLLSSGGNTLFGSDKKAGSADGSTLTGSNLEA